VAGRGDACGQDLRAHGDRRRVRRPAGPGPRPDHDIRPTRFAGIGAVEVPTLAIEQHLAEKLHAYTRTYAGGRPSTRVKDLVDVVVIANTSVIGVAKLAEAITLIFERRAEHPVPAALPEPPAEWATPWRRLAREVPAHDELGDGYRVAAALFDPMLAGTVATGAWQPGEGWVT
jgi:hypothetical protein